MIRNKIRTLRLTIIFLPIFSTFSLTYAENTLKERLEQHVWTLASDEMRGRRAGSESARKAAQCVIKQWEEIGIEPFFGDSYLQPFWNNRFQNVVGVIRGNDPVLKNEYIIVGAHYDGIGTRFGRIRNGADDNASGVAALIELGRELQQGQSKLKRSVILIAFDAEEIGLIGSTHFIANWKGSIEDIKLMISVDMVGWYEASGEMRYLGSGTIQNGNEIISNPQIAPTELNVVANVLLMKKL
jgi:acetylornithine deacetylase/succinyl-diaminopimelate desuccinylase-like protein